VCLATSGETVASGSTDCTVNVYNVTQVTPMYDTAITVHSAHDTACGATSKDSVDTTVVALQLLLDS
jgi:hypothetical protein